MIVGPTNPPIVPIELMNARPPAAARPLRKRGGIVQKSARARVDAAHRHGHPQHRHPEVVPANRIDPTKPTADDERRPARGCRLCCRADRRGRPRESSSRSPRHRRRWSRTRSRDRVSRPVSRICGRNRPMPYEPTRNPNCTPARISTRGSLSASRDVLDLLRPPFGLEPFANDAPLIVVEPRRVLGTIGQHEQQHDAGNATGKSFDQEQPLPARDAERPSIPSSIAGERAADDGRDRNRHHEPGDDPRAVSDREPGGEIERDARERSRPRRHRAAGAGA